MFWKSFRIQEYFPVAASASIPFELDILFGSKLENCQQLSGVGENLPQSTCWGRHFSVGKPRAPELLNNEDPGNVIRYSSFVLRWQTLTNLRLTNGVDRTTERGGVAAELVKNRLGPGGKSVEFRAAHLHESKSESRGRKTPHPSRLP
jgi:hypothetical protein